MYNLAKSFYFTPLSPSLGGRVYFFLDREAFRLCEVVEVSAI
jgi:hypothetical protein